MYVCAIRIVLVHSWFLVILRCLWWVTTHKSDSWAAACKTGPTATLGISSRKAPPGAQGAGTGDWPAHELFSMDFKWFHYKTNSINSSPIWSRAQEIQMQLASICLGLHRSVEPSLMCLRLGTQDAIRKPGLPEKEWNSLHGMLEIVYPCVDIYEYIYISLSLSFKIKHIKPLPSGTFGASSSLKCRCDFPVFAFRGCLANWNSPSVQWGAETTTGHWQSYQLRSSCWCRPEHFNQNIHMSLEEV